MTDKSLNWVKVLDTIAIDGPDFIRKVSAEGTGICIVKQGKSIFAVGSRCPHAGADLSQGWCQQGHIVCPYHRHEFDLLTGRGKQGQGNYINTYPVEVRPDGIYCGMKRSFWKFW